MSESLSSMSPAKFGVTALAAGTVIGYVNAPLKYNLEQLLTQKPDVFEKSLPRKKLKGKGKAFNVILEAREAVKNAIKHNNVETKVAELIKTPNLEKAYKTIRKALPKARTENALLVGIVSGILGTFVKVLFGDSKN